MLAAIFAVTIHHRRPILAIALVLAVILAVGRQLSTWLDLILGNATFVVGVLACSLAALAWRRSQPAALSVKPEIRAFATEPSASQISLAVGLMFLASLLLGTGHLAGEGLFMVLPFLLLVAVGLHFSGAAHRQRPPLVHRRRDPVLRRPPAAPGGDRRTSRVPAALARIDVRVHRPRPWTRFLGQLPQGCRNMIRSCL
ncbi:hypothetical protein [Micromonospora chersina]|uniref:hypothetical protein n=1 Tax=Micromonospora chersina TaxID=47854 RepID=UPI003721679F